MPRVKNATAIKKVKKTVISNNNNNILKEIVNMTNNNNDDEKKKKSVKKNVVKKPKSVKKIVKKINSVNNVLTNVESINDILEKTESINMESVNSTLSNMGEANNLMNNRMMNSMNNLKMNQSMMNSENNRMMNSMNNLKMNSANNRIMKKFVSKPYISDTQQNIHKTNARINFNKILGDCVKDKDFSKMDMSNANITKLEQEYDNSFDDIKQFRNEFTISDLNAIDTIVYHDENNDGMISCTIARHYLMENGVKVRIISSKPGRNIPEHLLERRNVLIVDLSMKSEVLSGIKRVCNSLIVIDDHAQTLKDKQIFNGIGHSASAYTWKFFYPRLNVPMVIQYIDDSDAKLFLQYIPRSYSHLFNHALGFRYAHNKSPEMMQKKRNFQLFDELWYVINETFPNFWITLGNFYSEVSENLKEQISINAVVKDFQGYRVGCLNFLAPAITKPVGRQIIDNLRNKGEKIDFAVLFGYEFTSNGYRVQLIDDHHQKKFNLQKIAVELGKLGGHPKGGGGHEPHIGNFYWPRNSTMDIWSLFEQQYL